MREKKEREREREREREKGDVSFYFVERYRKRGAKERWRERDDVKFLFSWIVSMSLEEFGNASRSGFYN